jgi:hypothetical protein
MAKIEKVCCRLCGRDTASRSGICALCYGCNSHEEERGRKGRRWSAHNDSPFDDVFESNQWEETAEEEYNGPTIRDDL